MGSVNCAELGGTVAVAAIVLFVAALPESQWLKELKYAHEAFPDFSSYYCPNIPPYGGLRAIGEHVCQELTIVYDTGQARPTTAAEQETPDVADSLPAVDFSAIDVPLALWWTGFTKERGKFLTCGVDKARCFFTANRRYRNHTNLHAFLFYGTDLRLHDLPLPRDRQHQWALLHEESPKNNWFFSSKDFLSLFNYTSTFRRESDYPLTTMWLGSLASIESRSNYYLPVSDKNLLLTSQQIAPIAYVQSDCDAPSDRDHLVQMLAEHIKIDSYGRCLHNKDLPEHISHGVHSMEHPDFYKLLGKYKFIIAMENAVCDDYITEKFWRAFHVGTVPIVYGSPKIRDYLPTPGSAILVIDHETVASLVSAIEHLNSNDDAYEAARAYKYTGITNSLLLETVRRRDWGSDSKSADGVDFGFISGFECFVCHQLHARLKQPQQHTQSVATENHYGCPAPWTFRNRNNLAVKHVPENFYHRSRYRDEMAKVAIFLDWYASGKVNFTETDLNAAVLERALRKRAGQRTE